MPTTEKTQETQDSNKRVMLKAVQSLQQMLHLIDGKDFTGSVAIEVYAQRGRAGKVRTNVAQFHEPN